MGSNSYKGNLAFHTTSFVLLESEGRISKGAQSLKSPDSCRQHSSGRLWKALPKPRIGKRKRRIGRIEEREEESWATTPRKKKRAELALSVRTYTHTHTHPHSHRQAGYKTVPAR